MLTPDALARIREAAAEVRGALGEDDDERAFWDTLAMLTDVEEIADGLLRRMAHAKTMAAALTAERADLKARLTTFNRQAERADAMLAAVVKASGQRKMTRPRATLYFSTGQERVELAPDFECPKQLLKHPPAPPPAPDLDAIMAHLRANPESIPGARIARAPETFNVRTK